MPRSRERRSVSPAARAWVREHGPSWLLAMERLLGLEEMEATDVSAPAAPEVDAPSRGGTAQRDRSSDRRRAVPTT